MQNQHAASVGRCLTASGSQRLCPAASSCRHEQHRCPGQGSHQRRGLQAWDISERGSELLSAGFCLERAPAGWAFRAAVREGNCPPLSQLGLEPAQHFALSIRGPDKTLQLVIACSAAEDCSCGDLSCCADGPRTAYPSLQKYRCG